MKLGYSFNDGMLSQPKLIKAIKIIFKVDIQLLISSPADLPCEIKLISSLSLFLCLQFKAGSQHPLKSLTLISFFVMWQM